MDHHQDHDGRNKMDLSLKIGLPYQNGDDIQHVNRHVNQDYSNYLPNFNFINPYIAHQQLASERIMIDGGSQANASGMVNLTTPSAINYGMSNIANNMTNMNLNTNSALSWPNIPQHNNYFGHHHIIQYDNTHAVGIPIMPHHQYANNFNYGDHTISIGSSTSSATSSSSNSRRKDLRRQRSGNYIDINRRCTNISCNTNDTPMWRKGPLGPKSLCNACGIKYRKETERKKAKEAEKNSNNNA